VQILAIERELAAINALKHRNVLRQEAARVWALKKRSVIRDIWFTVADQRAVLILECRTVGEAKRLLSSLPLVRERLIDFDVFALRSYNGFDRLFDP
jgi:muconolactone delta-isomerase